MEKSSDSKKELLDSLIGMDVESGSKLCKENGYVVRITREDSLNYMVTMDLRFDRINLEIDNGLITNFGIG
jgi:hypothetical protein